MLASLTCKVTVEHGFRLIKRDYTFSPPLASSPVYIVTKCRFISQHPLYRNYPPGYRASMPAWELGLLLINALCLALSIFTREGYHLHRFRPPRMTSATARSRWMLRRGEHVVAGPVSVDSLANVTVEGYFTWVDVGGTTAAALLFIGIVSLNLFR